MQSVQHQGRKGRASEVRQDKQGSCCLPLWFLQYFAASDSKYRTATLDIMSRVLLLSNKTSVQHVISNHFMFTDSVTCIHSQLPGKLVALIHVCYRN